MKKIKNIAILSLLVFLTVSFTEITNDTKSNNPDIGYVCDISTSKVRRLVRDNWSSIRSNADFTVSSRGSFEIRDYGLDGDDLVVDIYSKGYWFDISFTTSFDAYFDGNCNLEGTVLDVYNYRRH